MEWLSAGMLACTLAGAAAATGMLSLQGLVTGAVLAAVLAAKGGWPALAGLGALFFLGSLATRWRIRSQRSATHESRGVLHALANAGPAAALAWVASPNLAGPVALAALCGALADTLASELGLLAGGTPRMLLLGRRVPAGTDGGMSWCGTLVCAAVASLVWLALSLADVDPSMARAVGVGVFLTPFVDSVLGATVESHLPESMGNHMVNALATASGGAFVLWSGAAG